MTWGITQINFYHQTPPGNIWIQPHQPGFWYEIFSALSKSVEPLAVAVCSVTWHPWHKTWKYLKKYPSMHLTIPCPSSLCRLMDLWWLDMICMFEVWEGLGNLRGFTRDSRKHIPKKPAAWEMVTQISSKYLRFKFRHSRVSSGFKPTNFDDMTDLMQVLEVVERYNQTLQGMISSVDSKGSHWL